MAKCPECRGVLPVVDSKIDEQTITLTSFISFGANHVVGLKSDGTVVAVGYNKNGECHIDGQKLFC